MGEIRTKALAYVPSKPNRATGGFESSPTAACAKPLRMDESNGHGLTLLKETKCRDIPLRRWLISIVIVYAQNL